MSVVTPTVITGFVPGVDYPTGEDLGSIAEMFADLHGVRPSGEWTIDRVPHLFPCPAPLWRRWLLRQRFWPEEPGWHCQCPALPIDDQDPAVRHG